MNPRLAGRLALLAFLAIYGFVALRTPDEFRLLDSVDLAIHETGHLVFAPFGEWMGMAGGTIFQLLVPIAFVDRLEEVVAVRELRRNWLNSQTCCQKRYEESARLVPHKKHDPCRESNDANLKSRP